MPQGRPNRSLPATRSEIRLRFSALTRARLLPCAGTHVSDFIDLQPLVSSLCGGRPKVEAVSVISMALLETGAAATQVTARVA